MKHLKSLLLICCCLLIFGQAFAQSGYQVQQLSFSSAGTYGQSSDHRFTGSVGDLLQGDGQSTGYGFSGGFNFNPDSETGPPTCCLNRRGNVDNSPDDLIDISDLIELVAYMFQGGADPQCFEEGDFDGSGSIDIADLTSMVSYMFLDGPLPTECSAQPPELAVLGKISSISAYVSSNESGERSIVLETPVSIRGLHIKLSVNDSVQYSDLLDDRFDIMSFQSNNQMEIGIVDLDGGNVITEGTHSLVQLDGEFELSEIVISDMNHNSYYVNIVAAKGEDNLPNDFSLSQNYPNPFNPSTVINYSLPKTAHVAIEVFNINGQMIATLENRKISAGVHQVEWDGTNSSGSHVASGLYFYRIQADSFKDTKKMMLLK